MTAPTPGGQLCRLRSVPVICLFVSGQVCVDPEGKLIAKGKLGAGVTLEQGNLRRRAAVRSICWRRSRPHSAISTRWSAW